jgi:hypothetical protein
MYKSLLDSLNISYDAKCRNSSRWYYGNPEGEHWYNKGELLDIRPFIPDSVEQKSARQSYDNYDTKEFSGHMDERVDGAIRWFLKNTAEGNRNDMMFRMGAMLKDKQKIGCDNWNQVIEHVNSCLSKPLTTSEMKSTVNSINKRVS